jgi:hypothetical protein
MKVKHSYLGEVAEGDHGTVYIKDETIDTYIAEKVSMDIRPFAGKKVVVMIEVTVEEVTA